MTMSIGKIKYIRHIILAMIMLAAIIYVWVCDGFHYENEEVAFPEISAYDTFFLDEGDAYEYSFTAKGHYLQSVNVVLINLDENATGNLLVSCKDEKGTVIADNKRQLSDITPGIYNRIQLRTRLKVGKKYTVEFSQQNASLSPMLICNPGYENDTELSLIDITYMNTASNWMKFAIILLLLTGCVFVGYGERINTWKITITRAVVAGVLLVQFVLIVPKLTYALENIYFDPSWRYVLNQVGADGYKFGKNIFFTYGPMGYVCYLMNIPGYGKSFFLGVTILCLIVVFNLYLFAILYKLFSDGNISFQAIVMSGVMYIATYAANTWDNYMLYLLITDVVLYGLTKGRTEYKKINVSLVVACNIMLILMAFSKFSTFTSSMCFLFLFVVYSLIVGAKGNKIEVALLFVPGVVCMPLIYLLYCHSFSAMIAYFGRMISISDNWMLSCQWNQSVSGIDLLTLIAIIALYIIIIVVCMVANVKNSQVVFALSASMFFAYKYATTRHGLVAGIWLFSLLFASSLLAIDWKILEDRFNKLLYYLVVACTIMIGVLQVLALKNTTGLIKEDLYTKIHSVLHLRESSIPQSVIDEFVISGELLEVIQDDAVTVWPNNVAVDAVNPELNVVYYPSIQHDLTVDPDIEEADGLFFSDIDAPEYIMVQNESMNDRIKYVDVPHVWKAWKENYSVVTIVGDTALLSHKDGSTENVESLELIKSGFYDINNAIEVPNEADYVKIYPELTLWGKFCKFFYHIPVTNYTICYSNGDADGGRAIFPSLINGFSLDYYPKTNEELMYVLLDDQAQNPYKDIRITQIIFGGEGLNVLKNNIKVEWYSYQ